MSNDFRNLPPPGTEARRVLVEQLLARRRAAVEDPPIGAAAEDMRSGILSPAQERMWFLHEMNPTSAAYTITTVYRLHGNIDMDALRNALAVVAMRHEMLRSSLSVTATGPIRKVAELVQPVLRVVNVTEQNLFSLIAEEAERPFDLSAAPLFRAALGQVGPRDAILVFTFHHIIMDGWSIGLFNRDFGRAYAVRFRGPLPSFPQPTFDCVIHRQMARLRNGAGRADLDYWGLHLGDAPPLELPMAGPRPPIARFVGRRHEVHLGEALAATLEVVGRRMGATLYMVTAAAFAVLLHCYSGQTDIVFGTPVAGRTDPDTENLIGLFVNTVVLRINLSGQLTLADVVQQVRGEALSALNHQGVPFERVVERVAPKRTLSHNPLFQVMFALQNFQIEPPELPGIAVSSIAPPESHVRFDLECTLWRRTDGITLRFVYNTDIIDPPTAARLAGHYRNVLEALAADPSQPVATTLLLRDQELQIAFARERGPDLVAAADRLHVMFDCAADANPDAIALRDAAGALTFRELDGRANQLARSLIARGARSGDVIGICLPRTVELCVAVLGVLKAGCAFLPLSPADPPDRHAFVLADASARFLVTTRTAAPKLSADAAVIDVSEASDPPTPLRPDIEVGSASLAYIIYTSGTTGRPKGALVEHGNITSTLRACQQVFGFATSDVGLVLAAATFDVFYYELFAPILAGGTARLVDRDELFDPTRLVPLLLGATCFQAVPGLMEQLLAALRDQGVTTCAGMRLVMTGGDAVPPGLFGVLHRVFANADVCVTYGPTEAAIFCTAYTALRGIEVTGHPVGRPLPGTVVRIGDDGGVPLPEGVAGEIWIGGRGVCRGYLNRPDETAAHFVTVNGERFYRSGDRARRGADGDIEFLGRADRQVKVRGFRIELGEVEAVLAAAPGITHAVAVAIGDTPTDRLLVAHVVLDGATVRRIADGALAAATVDRWRNLFDGVYDSRVRQLSGNNDFTGWNSSYTTLPFPREEMDEWVAGTLSAVRSRIPPALCEQRLLRVLEIGCGTGLVLLKLAPECARYVGTDLSNRALSDLGEKVRMLGLEGVELLQASNDLGDVGGDFDVAVINSVSQYLPDEAYLRRILDAALARVRLGGFVFVGDVRSLPLLATFRFATEAVRRPGPPFEMLARAAMRVADEVELVIHPAYFVQYAAATGLVSHVEAEPRRGRFGNEMTRYRYDVVLHRGEPLPTAEVEWRDWGADRWTLEQFRLHLAERSESLGLTGIPNALLEAELAAHASAAMTAKRPVPAIPAGEAVVPEELRAATAAAGYHIDLSCLRGTTDGTFDAYLRRAVLPESLPVRWPLSPVEGPLTNDPLRRAAERQVVKAVHGYLAGRLPEYMRPSVLVVADTLPLTPNGKVDRDAIGSLPFTPSADGSGPPRTTAERLVAAAWIDVLGAEPSVADDFFEVGGTSLLALHLAVGLRARGVRFNPQDVFSLRTIERMGAALEGQLATVPPERPVPRASNPVRPRPPVPVLGPAPDAWEGAGDVLLTGATGMLGIHLLEQLLWRDGVRVICLVRAADDVAAAERLAEQYNWYFPGVAPLTGRVTVVAADLRLPRFGLSPTRWHELANTCRHIIHSAADVRHVASANEIFATNLTGTRSLLDLAGVRAVFHHISTTGVAGVISDEADEVLLTEENLDVGQTATEPYSESKRCAEEAVREFLRVGRGTVFRVGTVAPHSVSGRFQRNIDGHFFSRYLRSTLELGIACDWRGRWFSLLPVDLLARAVLGIAGRTEAIGHTFHLDGPHRVTHGEIVSALQSMGYAVSLLEPDGFARALAELGRDLRNVEAVGRLLPLLERAVGRRVQLDASWTAAWLEQLGLTFPSFQHDWFEQIVRNGVARGYFPARSTNPTRFDGD